MVKIIDQFIEYLLAPDNEFKKCHHENAAGYDIEFITWQRIRNPHYVGNFMQARWYWEGTKHLIKDAHKCLNSLLK